MKKSKKNIIIGVCGGIAAYKTCQLIRLLRKDNYQLKVVMTPAASQFIRPLLFKELSGQPVYSELFSLENQNTQHIKLSDWADLGIIAPLSANTLSKFAVGICDNLLTTVVCALGSKIPFLIAPSMNEGMWQNPIIQKNLKSLEKLKNYTVFLPESGQLACGKKGVGRMAQPVEIYKKAKTFLK